jgi:hypothetical protein
MPWTWSPPCILLRLRHQLGYVRRRQPYQMMAEETVALAVKGRSAPEWLSDEATAGLLECQPTGNLPREAIHREVVQALDFLQAHPQRLEALAHERAQVLLADHRRVREAARDVGQYSVQPLFACRCDWCVCPPAGRSVTRCHENRPQTHRHAQPAHPQARRRPLPARRTGESRPRAKPAYRPRPITAFPRA